MVRLSSCTVSVHAWHSTAHYILNFLPGNLHLNVTSRDQNESLRNVIEPFVYEFTGLHHLIPSPLRLKWVHPIIQRKFISANPFLGPHPFLPKSPRSRQYKCRARPRRHEGQQNCETTTFCLSVSFPLCFALSIDLFPFLFFSLNPSVSCSWTGPQLICSLFLVPCSWCSITARPTLLSTSWSWSRLLWTRKASWIPIKLCRLKRFQLCSLMFCRAREEFDVVMLG